RTLHRTDALAWVQHPAHHVRAWRPSVGRWAERIPPPKASKAKLRGQLHLSRRKCQRVSAVGRQRTGRECTRAKDDERRLIRILEEIGPVQEIENIANGFKGRAATHRKLPADAQ